MLTFQAHLSYEVDLVSRSFKPDAKIDEKRWRKELCVIIAHSGLLSQIGRSFSIVLEDLNAVTF